MKKTISLLTAVLCIAALWGCQAQQADPNPPVKPSFTAETLPRLDGSTATIPLSEGIVQALLGYTPEQAQAMVKHNKTHSAYENLIAGSCDIIFVTPPSEEEMQMMEDSGIEFEIVMAVKDAFVFLNSADNPVTDISLENLRKIYKGEISNWSELGGEDGEILAYQRPDNSGSQTLMYKLVVPKAEIAEPLLELTVSSMEGLIESVASFETGKQAIGYSVYYFASDMYAMPGAKLLAVDGIAPTHDTIADGTYPLSDGYYAIYRKDAAADSPVRQLMAWLTGDSGQQMADAQGYVPLKVLE